MFLTISQISRENTCLGVFFNKVEDLRFFWRVAYIDTIKKFYQKMAACSDKWHNLSLKLVGVEKCLVIFTVPQNSSFETNHGIFLLETLCQQIRFREVRDCDSIC